MDKKSLVFLVLALATFCQCGYASRCGFDLNQAILNQIFVGYNNEVRPPPGDNATLVISSALVRNIVWVDEKKHQWMMDVFIRQSWNDPRLQYTNLLNGCNQFQYVSLTTKPGMDRLWKPNFFIFNKVEVEVHDVSQYNAIVRIHPNGDVVQSVHVMATLFCTGAGSKPGEFLCPMTILPFGPTTDEIVMRWQTQDPVQLDRNTILLDEHQVGNIDTLETVTDTQLGRFSTIVANFHFLGKTCLK